MVAETDEAVEELVAAGVAADDVRLIPYGVDLERWRAPTPAERDGARRRLGIEGAAGVVVWCGRFDLRQKRLDVLLEGWDAAALPGWRLVLAGEGPDGDAVCRLADRLDPPPVLLPWQADPRLVLAAADAFVQPTAAETTGMAILEALAMELPGIVSATSLAAAGPLGSTIG